MFSLTEIENLATLSRLRLSEEEMASLAKDFPKILEYVGQVNEAQAVRPASSVAVVETIMREDEPRADADLLAGKQEAMLSQAPRREGAYIAVKKILQKDE